LRGRKLRTLQWSAFGSFDVLTQRQPFFHVYAGISAASRGRVRHLEAAVNATNKHRRIVVAINRSYRCHSTYSFLSTLFFIAPVQYL